MPLSRTAVQTRTRDLQGSRVRGRLVSGKPNPVDVHVGGRLRGRRIILGMSQGTVGKALGLTFQQIQKYERGSNRISASRLWDLSSVLGCPVAFFFEEMDTLTAEASPRKLVHNEPDAEKSEKRESVTSETLALVQAYYQIPGASIRRRIYELAQTLAAAPNMPLK